jgi:hypothetical protein
LGGKIRTSTAGPQTLFIGSDVGEVIRTGDPQQPGGNVSLSLSC